MPPVLRVHDTRKLPGLTPKSRMRNTRITIIDLRVNKLEQFTSSRLTKGRTTHFGTEKRIFTELGRLAEKRTSLPCRVAIRPRKEPRYRAYFNEQVKAEQARLAKGARAANARQLDAKLKGSIGEGPKHSNFSDQSSNKILAKFRNVRQTFQN